MLLPVDNISEVPILTPPGFKVGSDLPLIIKPLSEVLSKNHHDAKYFYTLDLDVHQGFNGHSPNI